jgi:hypothetical protein
MPYLPAPLVDVLWGLLVVGAIAVLAALFPTGRRCRRKKPEEFQHYYEPPKMSWGVYVILVCVMLLPIGLIVWLYWGGWQPPAAEHSYQQATPPTPIPALPRAIAPERPAVAAPGFDWTLFILAVVVGLGMLGGGVWLLCGDRLAR